MSSEFSPNANGASKSADDDAIDLGNVVATLWRGKWIIAAGGFLCVVAAIIYVVVFAVPIYQSTAVVIMETQQDSIVDIESVTAGFSGDSTAVNSEVEVLRSRLLMEKVVDRLNLTADPEFNGILREPGLKTKVSRAIQGLLGQGPETSQTDAAALDGSRELSNTINALLNSVTIRNIPQSLVFQITVKTKSAEKSALIADSIVDLYVLNQIEVKFLATEQATKWLTERVTTLKEQLEESEAKVADFSATTTLVSIEGLQGAERQLKDFRERINAAQEARDVAVARLAALEAAVSREDKALAAQDSQLDRLLPRVASDDVVATAFDTRFEQTLQRAELEAQRAIQQSDALTASEAPLQEQITSQGKDLIVLQQLQREAEASRLLYEYFLGRLKETSAQQGIQQADSRILSNAVVPNGPATPRKTLMAMLAGVIGGMLGIAIIMLREARSSSFRTARELEEFTGKTVLGQIPQIPARARKKVVNYLSEKPTSAPAEAIRNLRTSILLSDVDNPPKVIVCTSSLLGEGKTTNSLALAQNLIGMGNKVLLIEGDIRRRTFNEYFNNIPAKGMVAVLSGEIKLDEAIFRSDGFNCDLLVGEKTATNAADLFSSTKFKEMLLELRSRYDIIIIDTPPVLVVPDARIIAKQADALLFTVKWDTTTKAQVEESMRLFRDANQKVTGLVLSQISIKGMKRYGYGGKYGAYAGYGSKYYDN